MRAAELVKVALVASVFTVFGVGAVYAATTTVTATIKFLTDLTITPVTQPNFGYVQAATAGTYTLSATTGLVTASGVGLTEGGSPAAGNFLIKGSGNQAITVKTSAYVVNGTSTPSNATCKYGAGVETACDAGISVAAPGTSGTTLLLGLKVVTTGAADNQTETPSFTLAVTYN